MIIYKRKKKQLVIPCGLGPVVCPDTSHNLQMKMVDSSTMLQQIEPDEGYYGLYRVIINPLTDPNLLPDNIKEGVELFGVTGTYAGEIISIQDRKTVEWSEVPTLLQWATFEPDEGYDAMRSLRLRMPKTFIQYVTPSTSAQSFRPQNIGYDYYRGVEVDAVTADIDPDIQPENIKKDVEILGVIGTYEGAVINNQSKTVNSSTSSQTVIYDSSYTGLSSVTVNPYTVESRSQTITQNGTYSFAPTSADALSDVSISVEVAGTPATVQDKSVTYNENGEYTVTPDQGYDGLSSVDISVNVPTSSPVLQTKTVNSSTASQTVQSDGGYDGLSEVIVNPYTVEANSSTLTQNGTYSFSPVNADALSGVTVNVSVDGGQTVNNQAKTVNSSTSSQSVTFDSGYTGLSQVTVNPYTLDTKTVNPSTNLITVNSSADGMSSVTVNAVTAAIDPNIQVGNIKDGVTILGVTGTYTGDSSSADAVYLNAFAIEKIQDNDCFIETNYLPDSNLNRITGFFKGGDPSKRSILYSLHPNFDAISDNLLTFRFGGSAVNYRVYFINDEVDFEHGIMFDASLNGNKWTVTVNGVTKTCSSPGFPSSHVSNVWLLGGYSGNPALSFITFENGADSWTFSPIAVADVSNNLINSYYSLALRELHSVGGVDTVNYITEDSGGNSLLTNYRFVTYEANTSTGEIMDLTDASRNVVMFPIGDYPSGVKLPAHSLGSKTVDSSTVSQTVTPDASDYGLSSVTVNPYTVETDSSVLTSNGTYTFTPATADALSSVTIDVSVASGSVINNQNKTVNSSTSFQSITADSGYTGLGTVTVNPYTVETDSSTLTQNGTYTFTPQSADAISSVTVDVSVNSSLPFYMNDFMNIGTLSRDNIFDVSTFAKSLEIKVNNMTSDGTCFEIHDCPNLTHCNFTHLESITGFNESVWRPRFYNCPMLWHVDLQHLTTINGNSNVSSWISASAIKTNNFGITVRNSGPVHSSDSKFNIAYAPGNKLKGFFAVDGISDDAYFTHNGGLEFSGVFDILNCLDLTVSGKHLYFYSNGLTVQDNYVNQLTGLYNDAVNAGWIIHNLTILPYS